LKIKIFVSLSCCALFFGYYIHIKHLPPQKASRALASVDQGFDLLSRQELKLLTPKEQRNYLNKISQIIVKAGVFKGAFRDRSKSKVSRHRFDFSIGVPKAYAEHRCLMHGLLPFVRGNESECSILPKALKISEDSKSLFTSAAVGSVTIDGEEQSTAKCPEGQEMCNPALIGFDFDSTSGKARLRCLDRATNEACFGLPTSGEQMKKSLDLIDQANPLYWNEFISGIEEQCLVGGEFNESDDGCDFARRQMNYSTRTYRNKLTQRYKDLAAKLNEQSASDAADKKVCRQHTSTDSEMALPHHENFNRPGFKIMYKRGQCWRVPTRSTAQRINNQYRILLPDGDERSADDIAGLNPDDPNSTSDPSVVLMQDIGGLGSAADRVGDVRFYNFQCGPCNDAADIASCVFNMRKPLEDRSYARIANNRVSAIGTDDCRALIEKLETAELPDVVFEKARAQGEPFYQSRSID